MSWWKPTKLGWLGVLPLVAAQPSQEPTVFHSGTRLVEVEVVVRDQRVRPPGVGASLAYFLDSGPPFGPPGALHTGLTKDDFTLLDQGKPQPIALFRTGSAGAGSPGGVPLPPSVISNRPVSNRPVSNRPVSNRQDSRGQPVNGATAVLIDFLNTRFGCRGYERLHSGWYDVRVKVDLHDIHLDHKEGHFTGAFDLLLKNPSANIFKTGAVAVDFKDEQLAEALEKGWNVSVTGVESELGEIRVVVRDRATGIAGSVRIPVAKQ
jgi:hypothetical protein